MRNLSLDVVVAFQRFAAHLDGTGQTCLSSSYNKLPNVRQTFISERRTAFVQLGEKETSDRPFTQPLMGFPGFSHGPFSKPLMGISRSF